MTYTLDEYKEKIALIKELVCEELADIADDELLLILSCWRDEDDLICMGTYHNVFIDYELMIQYICKESGLMATSDKFDEEPIIKRLYWEVCKYKRVDGKIEALYECTFSTDGHLLTVNIDNIFLFYNDYTERQKEIENFDYLLQFPHNVILPYKIGDILFVDAPPFGKPFYVVYGGEMEKNELLMSDYHQYHWCFYKSYDTQELKISDLSNSCFTDYIFFHNSPLTRIRLAVKCDEPLIVNASKTLKENPDLWYEWCDTAIKRVLKDGDAL